MNGCAIINATRRRPTWSTVHRFDDDNIPLLLLLTITIIKDPFVTFVRFCFAGAHTPALGAQQGTAGSHRLVGVVAARPGEDQKRTATPFASPGKFAAAVDVCQCVSLPRLAPYKAVTCYRRY